MDYWYRRVTATIKNESGQTLTLVTPVPKFDWGQWVGGGASPPPNIQTIENGGEQQFVVESAHHSTGCEGRLQFRVGDTSSIWEIYWNNPFINGCGETNDYTQTLDGKPHGTPVDQDDVDDCLAVCKYTSLPPAASDKPGASPANPPSTQNAAAEAGKPAHISAPAGPTIVLTLVATFPNKYGLGNDLHEIGLMNNGSWSPTSTDFEAIAKFETQRLNDARAGSAQMKAIVGMAGFLAAFADLKAGVRCSRVNLITHSIPTSVALSGTVAKDGTTTWHGFDEDIRLALSEADRRKSTIASSDSLDEIAGEGCFPFGGATKYAWFHDAAKARMDREDIRARMAPGAEFHLYSCKSATKEPGSILKPVMLQRIADAFNVKTFGFTTPIFYLPKISKSKILDRNITGLGNSKEEALKNAQAGIFHNDSPEAQKSLSSFIAVRDPKPEP